MSNLFESFNPESIFSADNPFLKSARSTHNLFAEAFDRTARMQLAFGEELLDLNRKRFESLYAGESVQDTLTTQQELAVEAGQRASALADSFKQVISDFQSGVSEAANEWINVATDAVNNVGKPAKASKAKAKAA